MNPMTEVEHAMTMSQLRRSKSHSPREQDERTEQAEDGTGRTDAPTLDQEVDADERADRRR